MAQGDTPTTPAAAAGSDLADMPAINVAKVNQEIDLATIFGIISVFALIATAILLGRSNANFFNIPSILIVILGTFAATLISYTGREMLNAWSIFTRSLNRRSRKPELMARQLLDLAVVARKKGILALTYYNDELRKDPFLFKAVQMVADGFDGNMIERVLTMEVDSLLDRHKRSAGIFKRASEIAPAMGLIGTLVGLVQMLAELDDPTAIGPAMAVALLTTFYGAILGTIILSPIAAKLERNSRHEAMVKHLVVAAAGSIARQENPRQLEMLLNSELPPRNRIRYFD